MFQLSLGLLDSFLGPDELVVEDGRGRALAGLLEGHLGALLPLVLQLLVQLLHVEA